jgi:phosphatidylglycerophosphate synthase
MSFSTFTAISELFVTAGVLYLVWQNYNRRGFNSRFALLLISFEFMVNMLYMTMRMGQHSQSPDSDPTFVAIAATHGIFSLLTFILLVIYATLAHSEIKKSRYFFADHPIQTKVFLVLWFISVGSGEILYFMK